MRIIGFREHRLGDNGLLLAINGSFGEWRRGQNEAALGAVPNDDSLRLRDEPQIGISYPHGFHAFYKPLTSLIGTGTSPLSAPTPWAGYYIGGYGAPSWHSSATIQSAVTGWGRMVLHSDGWRAQYAEIHAVLSTQDRAVDDAIRKRYDVAVVTYPDELREIALKYGVEVADPSVETEGIREIERAPKTDPIVGYYMGQAITLAQYQQIFGGMGYAGTSWTSTHWSTAGLSATATAANQAAAEAESRRQLEVLEKSTARIRRAQHRVYLSLVFVLIALINIALIFTSVIRPSWSIFTSSLVMGMVVSNLVMTGILNRRDRRNAVTQ